MTGRTWFLDLMTTQEIAAVLRVHPRTVQRWGLEGKLGRIVLSPRTSRYRRSDLEALCDAREIPADAAPKTSEGDGSG